LDHCILVRSVSITASWFVQFGSLHPGLFSLDHSILVRSVSITASWFVQFGSVHPGSFSLDHCILVRSVWISASWFVQFGSLHPGSFSLDHCILVRSVWITASWFVQFICIRILTILRYHVLKTVTASSHSSHIHPKYFLNIYLAAVGLTPGGSSTVHIYTQTTHRI
jgi:hypothetical protein